MLIEPDPDFDIHTIRHKKQKTYIYKELYSIRNVIAINNSSLNYADIEVNEVHSYFSKLMRPRETPELQFKYTGTEIEVCDSALLLQSLTCFRSLI